MGEHSVLEEGVDGGVDLGQHEGLPAALTPGVGPQRSSPAPGGFLSDPPGCAVSGS